LPSSGMWWIVIAIAMLSTCKKQSRWTGREDSSVTVMTYGCIGNVLVGADFEIVCVNCLCG